jgi:hypothetical protein
MTQVFIERRWDQLALGPRLQWWREGGEWQGIDLEVYLLLWVFCIVWRPE